MDHQDLGAVALGADVLTRRSERPASGAVAEASNRVSKAAASPPNCCAHDSLVGRWPDLSLTDGMSPARSSN